MRLIKIVASTIFTLLIILALGMYLTVRNFDLNKYKPYVEDIVQTETGRKLTINGEAKLAISLVPTVVINDVTLSNPDWASNPNMIKVGQAKVKFALMPLLKKQIVIDEILLSAPEIYLEKQGSQANWEFGAKKVKSSTQKGQSPSTSGINPVVKGAALAGFAAKDVLIENGIVQYQDGRKIELLNIKKIALNVPNLDERINLEFNVLHNGKKIKGEAILGAVNEFLNQDTAYPVILDVSAYGIKTKLNGSIIGGMSNNPIYAFEANIYNPAGNMNAPETTLETRIDGDANGLKANISTLNIATDLITGTVDAKWSAKIPYLKANLKSNRFNLLNLQKSSPLAFALPSLIKEAQAIEVSDTKVPYELLTTLNADITLDVKKLIIAKGMEADNLTASIKLNNGVLNAKPLRVTFGGGVIDGQLSINANQQRIDLMADGKGLQLQSLHSEFAVAGNNDFGVIEGGSVDIYLNAVARGASYRQLLSSLDGRVIGIVGKSVMQTGGLAFLKGNLITQIFNILKIDTQNSTKLDLTCAVVRGDILKGIMTFPRGIAFDSKQITVVSDGKLNLINDKLDFTIEPSFNKLANGNVTQALASFVKLGGTIQNPRISLDNQEALKTIVGVAATGGMSYLGSQVLLNGDGSPCYTALEGTTYASRFPKPSGVKATTQNVVNDAQKQIKQGLKDLKNTAKDILNSFQLK